MGYLKELEALKAEVQGRAATKPPGMAWETWLNQLKEQTQASNADPWYEKLAVVRGKIGDDNIERVMTHELLAVCGVSSRGKQSGALRRIAEVMRSLGWTAVRKRGLTATGLLDQTRGWARQPALSEKKPARCPHCGGALP